MKKLTLVGLVMLITSMAWAQQTVKGIIVDKDTQEPLAGSTVMIKGTTNGIASDMDGKFEIKVPAGENTFIVSFIGYVNQEFTKSIKGNINLGKVELSPDAVGLKEVQVIASIGMDRKTPVAMSTLSPTLIQNKLGTKEFPEILSSTPGIYATKQGGGYGDARVNVRGFDSPNVAVMVNGIPINDMEWGGVYWSNWAGLGDVTRSMQVQRGLGASKIATPSVGGSINIITQTTDVEKGGNVYSGIGTAGYLKTGFKVSTGLMDNGWAVTFAGSKTSGDGYIQGTQFQAYSYFGNISKKISARQQLSFTIFGAPQWHNQRSSYDQQTMADWEKQPNKYKYNAAYGVDVNGNYMNTSYNFYHKPQASLNHYLEIDNTSSLNTSLYASIASGGGWGSQGAQGSRLYGSNTTDRTIDGYLDYGAVQKDNAINPNGSQAIIASGNNNHKWYGILSNYTKTINDAFTFSGGIDSRYYIGTHTRTIVNLMGGQFYTDDYNRKLSQYQSSDPNYLYQKLKVGDNVQRDYDGHVFSNGLFGQLEYSKDKLSTFLSLAGSNTTYWSVNRMYYAPGNQKSEMVNHLGYNLKGGANYNLTDHLNVFANAGYISRAPYFGSVFLNKEVTTTVNTNVKNQNITSFELGSGYTTKMFHIKVNAYYTTWMNKDFQSSTTLTDGSRGYYVAPNGVDARHKGIEAEGELKLTSYLRLTGMLSIGDWRWMDDASAYLTNQSGTPLDKNGNPVTNTADAAQIPLKIANTHVSDAAQTTAALGINFTPFKGLNWGFDYNYFGRYYAKVLNVNNYNGSDSWRVPDYGVFRTNIGYDFKIGGLDARVNANVDNIFNTLYISDATNGSNSDILTSKVFYGFGRTWSLGMKVNF